MKQTTDQSHGISDDTFDVVMKALITNKKNLELGKIKYMQWCEQDDFIFKTHGVSKKDWLFALNKRTGTHNRVEKKVTK